jgi:hypothetical protein
VRTPAFSSSAALLLVLMTSAGRLERPAEQPISSMRQTLRRLPGLPFRRGQPDIPASN